MMAQLFMVYAKALCINFTKILSEFTLLLRFFSDPFFFGRFATLQIALNEAFFRYRGKRPIYNEVSRTECFLRCVDRDRNFNFC